MPKAYKVSEYEFKRMEYIKCEVNADHDTQEPENQKWDERGQIYETVGGLQNKICALSMCSATIEERLRTVSNNIRMFNLSG